MKNAVIVVDMQKDFVDGPLAVSGGGKVIPSINSLLKQLEASVNLKPLVVYTVDWHPSDHMSFKDNGGEWPSHCVAGTPGADFAAGLTVNGPVFEKGASKDKDSYSGFGGKLRGGDKSLLEYLKGQGVESVIVVGLALDYCVKATALDAAKFGFKVGVYMLGTAAVNHKNTESVVDELVQNNVKVL